MSLAVIVPVLNEEDAIAAHLAALGGFRAAGARVIVVDGGSRDETRSRAAPHADLVLTAPRGRAAQMNAGARACELRAHLKQSAFLCWTGAQAQHFLAVVRQWGRVGFAL